jgi:hypothetical protein
MAYFKLHIVFWEPGASLKMISSLRRTLQRLQYYWALIHLLLSLLSHFLPGFSRTLQCATQVKPNAHYFAWPITFT